MYWTKMLIPTLREMPKDAEATSHKLMLRGGFILKLSSGVYDYLPLGFKVLKKIISIVREEMDASGAQEVLLPAIHPAEIWQKTGRYEVLKEILMTVKKDGSEMVLGPTHEEIITDLVSATVRSYKELPVNLYQIQAKFRDEARPRFGIIRSKEFIMKDAYSFDTSWDGVDLSYSVMYDTYQHIFNRCGLVYTIVKADPGAMGGNFSHEFMVKVPFGEDVIVGCSKCELSSAKDVAECVALANEQSSAQPLEEFATPNVKTIKEISERYDIKINALVKTLIYTTGEEAVACLVRGDCEICESKLQKILKAEHLSLADEKTILAVTGAPVGFAGPVGLKKEVRIIADSSVKGMTNFVTGANKKDAHIRNVNFGRDVQCDVFADIRYIREGETCPACSAGTITLEKSLEIGHVFKLGTKYSKALNAKFIDQDGKEQDIVMGCYGIGINRILAAAIELHHDDKGIRWPISIAPFEVLVLTVNHSEDSSRAEAEKIYSSLKQKNIDVLFDDRNARAGVKFTDAELIGFPIVVVVGERNLKQGKVELKLRRDGSTSLVDVDSIVSEVERVRNELMPARSS